MEKEESIKSPDESRKSGWEASKLRKLKIYTYVQNKLESLMKKDVLLVDTFNGKRFDLKNPTQETYDIALATLLARSGKLTDDEIAIILRNFFRHGMGNSGSDEYFAKIIHGAHETIQGAPPQKSVIADYKKYQSSREYHEVFMGEIELRKELHKASGRSFSGFDTGFSNLNDAIGGLQGQSLILMLGKAGSGKTAFCAQIAAEVARREEVPCLFVSYHQSLFRHNLMVFSRLTGIPHRNLANGQLGNKQYDTLVKVTDREIGKWGDSLVFMEADEAANIAALKSLCEETGARLLIIDSLEYIPMGRTLSPRYRIDEILSELSRLALTLKIAIMVIVTMEDETTVSDYLGGDAALHLYQSASEGKSLVMCLRIVKNRLGESEVTLIYEFNPSLFEFKEKGIIEPPRRPGI